MVLTKRLEALFTISEVAADWLIMLHVAKYAAIHCPW